MSPVDACRRWVQDMVLAYDLCPFAHLPWRNGQVGITHCDATEEQDLYRYFLSSVVELLDTPREKEETRLLVFDPVWGSFEEFWTFAGVCQDLLMEAQLEELVQLAHFHPQYQFADEPPGDPSHRTNQSPYPIIQLLRVESVAEAIESHPDVDAIPARNMEKMRKLAEP